MIVTAKVLIIYDSKYGNTKLVAEQIALGLKKQNSIEVSIGYVKEIDSTKLSSFDALIIGAPNHMGKPSRTISKFVDNLSKVGVAAKWAAAFDTYFQRDRYQGKAMGKLEKKIAERLPMVELLSPGLSIKVKGVNGPIVEGELPKAEEFGKRIGSAII